ncbi:MAG: alpha/beta hydrolase [Fibrobacteraceae bacterium]|nr:alpha/beta hydrolase [Fibrobacteraceae bacterium]
MSDYVIDVVELKGFEVRYVVFGNGAKSMVVFPGMSVGYVDQLAEGFYAKYRKFAQDYKVYLFDRPSNLNEYSSVETMAEDSVAALKILGLNDFYLIGYSQGGMMCQYIAINHPEMVKKLVLGSTLSKPNETYTQVMRAWECLSAAGDVVALNNDCFCRIYSETYYSRYKRALSMFAKVGTKKQLERFKYLSMAGLTVNCFDRLKEIICPVLAIGAEQDRVTTLQGIFEIVNQLGCDYFVYPEYGHSAYDEAKDYQERIEKFFKMG